MLSDAESTLMSAAGAVRLISVGANEQIEVVRTIQALIAGSYPDVDCPTSNAGGWRDYVDIFQALPSNTIDAIADGSFIVNDYGDRVEKLRSPELAKQLPDFADPRVPALRDHLAAFEWTFVEEESLLHDHAGANLVVDCRHLSQEHWERSPAYTIHRGLTSAATSIPSGPFKARPKESTAGRSLATIDRSSPSILKASSHGRRFFRCRKTGLRAIR